MRYQQTPISRFSKAASLLVKDESWHPFVSEPRLFYRVMGRMVQRVRLEPGEDDGMLALFDSIAPLPTQVLREGFREEVHFKVSDDAYALADIPLRVFIGWDALASAAEGLGARMDYPGGNSLLCYIVIEQWNENAIVHALLKAKAIATVAAQLAEDAKHGIPHTTREIAGLLRSAVELYKEDLPERPKPGSTTPPAASQGDLFASPDNDPP